MRIIKIIKWSIRILVATSVFLAISLFLLICTPTGSKLLIKASQSLIPPSVHLAIDYLSGTLLTRIHANITYSQPKTTTPDAIQFKAVHTQIKIDLLSLLSGNIRLSQLQAQSIAITTEPQTKKITTKTKLNRTNPNNSQFNDIFIPKIFINHFLIQALTFKGQHLKNISGNAYLHASSHTINTSVQIHGTYHSQTFYLSLSGYGPSQQFNSQLTFISHQDTIRHLTLIATGQGNLSQNYQFKLTGQALQNTPIKGNAKFNLTKKTWQTQLSITQLNLTQLNSRYSSQMNIRLTGDGNEQTGQLKLHLDGTLFKENIFALSNLSYSPHTINFNIQAHNGNNKIMLTGTPKQATLDINLKQIDHILPDSTGQINIHGNLNVNKINLTGNINHLILNAPEIHPILNNFRIKQARFNLDQNNISNTVTASLLVKNLILFKLPIKSINSQFKLKSKHFLLLTRLQTKKLQLDQQANGQLTEKNIINIALNKFTIENLEKNNAINQDINWSLVKPVTIKFNLKQPILLTASPFILKNRNHSQGLSLELIQPNTDNIYTIQAKLEKFPLNIINLVTLNKLQLTGSLSGMLNLKLNQATRKLIHIDTTLSSSAGEIKAINPASQRIKTVHFQPLSLIIQGDQNNLTAQFNWALGQADYINAQIYLDHFKNLVGHVNYSLKAVNILGFIPNINIQNPKLTGTLKLSGQITNPRIIGSTTLIADLYLPSTGVELKQTKMTLTADGSSHITIQAQATTETNQGYLSLHGNIDVTHLQPQATFIIQGSNVQLVDLPYATLYADPNITIAYGKRLIITGNLAMQQGRIQIDQVPQSTTLPSDIKIKGQTQNQSLPINTDITLTLNKSIHINGYGLNTQIEGQLNIISQPNQLTRAHGNLKLLDGTYRLLGQNLNITQGQLIFGGNAIQNPGLNINIERQITPSNPADEAITAGVKVTGNLNKPTLTPYSTPTLSKADILSYLLFGTPVPQTSSGNAAILAQLVTSSSLFNTGTGGIVQDIKKTFGLSELSIQSNTSTTQTTTSEEESNLDSLRSSTSLVLGKYLAPDLYISYSVGFLGQQIASVRYRLNQNWSINTEAGTTSAVDLFYNIEKD
ncbi:translocation/assembly module TamB domain-containing protein [Piscirickettsia salmonis]|uniref:translocation/assembly module TamB domain-containing protein n=1 Tax=Piscirickettsia salmonis TaxID=1238 RepID=UPI0012BAC3A6|nr:translocation/assembly module TamB domain-containing protein [Piscirickettsia salmonis]QGP59734.1 Autotransporter assembly factor TamB [Piscirickettsia salmonis]